MLTREIELRGGTASDTPTFGDARARLDEIVLAGDAVIFMGAGSVTVLASEYAGKPGAIEIVGKLSKVGV